MKIKFTKRNITKILFLILDIFLVIYFFTSAIIECNNNKIFALIDCIFFVVEIGALFGTITNFELEKEN